MINFSPRSLTSPLMAGLLLMVLLETSWAAEEAVNELDKEVRQTLSANCYACHGPDEASREADLRLDVRKAAVATNNNRRAITPGKRVDSELYRRITSTDPEIRMPPPDSGHELTPSQISQIGDWIDAGATFPIHWSFTKPGRPAVPVVKDQAWPRGPLDAFILARLEAAGLRPNAEADRYTLIRRLSLDLTGIPPTLDEAESFVDDPTDNAYEKLVDRLLESNRFGEQWARMWLDLARYADTTGYEKDQPRNIWRYRDWVIQAFNADMPYDQFTTEQLAGDLLPNPTTDQLLATAFHRNTLTNSEGGTDNEEFRIAAVKDRVDTTVQVWMGLTMGCAKCHSHKYDPLTQREYYRFFAYFNQTEDADRPDDAPRVATPTTVQQARQGEINEQLTLLREAHKSITPAFVAARTIWEQQLAQQEDWSPVVARSAVSAGEATLKVLEDRSLLVSGTLPPTDIYTIRAPSPLERITAIRLEALVDPSLPQQGPGRSKSDPNFVVNEFTLSVRATDGTTTAIPLTKARADFSQNGWDVAGAIDGKMKSGWAISPRKGQPHVALFTLAEPLAVAGDATLEVTISQQYGGGLVLGRFRISATAGEPGSLTPQLAPAAELAAIAVDRRTKAQQQQLDEAFRKVYPPTQAVSAQLDKLVKQLAELEKQMIRTPVMRELAANRARKTRMHVRGNFREPGDEVTAGLPAAFGELPADVPANRLAVARWLTQSENPLTSRVAVNRFWARIFGIGLVETEEDFGTQGMPPSHPELLDWLAVEFQTSLGWSMKQLCKTIVMSATYRQSSHVAADGVAVDPRNRLHGRAARFRLPAETLRDQALAAAGLLSTKLGGPSVMPPQPPGIWRTTYSKLQWETSAGEDRYRRALYTFWRRTSPYPAMTTFDVGSREVCAIRRVRTNTPLQALVLMNDPVYVEAAVALANRLIDDGNLADPARLDLGFRLVLVRPPSDLESERLLQLLETARSNYRDDVTAAKELLQSANITHPADVDPIELAAWTIVSNVLLNLDETLMRN